MTPEREIELILAWRTALARKEMLQKPVFFNQAKLAERWEVSRPTLSRWVSEGRIKDHNHPKGWSLREVLEMESYGC